jgi:hypothetical protein
MPEDELRDACLHAAATVAVAYALGCEFEDCRLDDDGRRWPVSLSVVEIKYPDGWRGKDDFVHVAMIHEAGAIAVAKSHGRSPHINTEDSDELFHNSLVPDASFSTEASGFPNHFHNPEFMAALRTSRTAVLLDIPLIWNVVKALAEFIRNNDEAEGSYGALGTDCAGVRDGEDSAAIKLMKEMGLTPALRWFEGRIERPKLALAAASASS